MTQNNDNTIEEFLKSYNENNSIFQYAFVKLVFPLAAGIFIASKYEISIPHNFILTLGFITIFTCLIKKIPDLPKTILIYAFTFATGIQTYNKAKPQLVRLPESTTGYVIMALDEPKLKAKTVQLPAQVIAYKDSGHWQIPEHPAKALFYIRKSSLSQSIKYGDTIAVYTKLGRVKNFGNPFEFDYAKYLSRKGIFYSGFVDTGKFKIINHGGGSLLISYAHKARNYLLGIYKKYNLPDSLFGIAGALTLGYRQALDRETQNSFAHSGAMHVLAVSGLHVGVLFAILFFGLKPLFRTKLKFVALLIILFVLWSFAFITGLSPSVRRSAFMFSLITFGRITRRQANIYNTLAASAFFMLLVFPLDLFEIGFWLSYAAVLSIVYFQPLIYKWFYFKTKVADWIWNLVSVSIAAQIGTMPIGLYVFHQFPNYFILTNLVAIPLASIILYSSLALFAVSWIPTFAKSVMFIFEYALLALKESVKFIEKLPFSYSEHIYISFFQMLLLYGLIFSVVTFFIKKNKRMAYYFLAMISLFIINQKFTNYKLAIPPRTILYNIPKTNAITAITNKKILLIADSTLVNNLSVIKRYFYPYWKRTGVKKIEIISTNALKNYKSDLITAKHYAFKIFDKTYYFSNNKKLFDNTANSKLKINYIILSNDSFTKLNDLNLLFEYDTLIISTTNKWYLTNKIKKQAEKNNIEYLDLSHGAIVVPEGPKATYWNEYKDEYKRKLKTKIMSHIKPILPEKHHN